MLDSRWFWTALVLASCGGCGPQGLGTWDALEVQRCTSQAVGLSLRGEEPGRAKAFAVQAASLAGDNQRLVGAAKLAAGWAEIMRGDHKLGGRLLRAGLEGLEPSTTTNDILLWVVRSHRQGSRSKEALEVLDWWRSRLDPNVHAHLVRPVMALRKELERPAQPTTPMLRLEDLLER